LNVADRLFACARQMPEAVAVVQPLGRAGRGKRRYRQITFGQLAADVEALALGMLEMGAEPGTRLALMVRPGIEFIALVFALLKSGVVVVLIDPGMGRKNLLHCLDDVQPAGFVAIPLVQAIRTLSGPRYRSARLNVTTGRRWFWGGETYDSLRQRGRRSQQSLPATQADDPAAIIFTTGSTGPPKGVLFTHRNFDTQVTEIRDHYGIEPGGIDLAAFPLFGLFNGAMGVTTVVPDMNPSRPAEVDPRNIVEAVRDWQVTQSFASPAVWKAVGKYCTANDIRLESLEKVFSAGAPVPAKVLAMIKHCVHPLGEIYTPYGATEALPVASISASEVLGETSSRTNQGAGVCVGRPLATIDWKVIDISEEPLETIDQTTELPAGDIGELIVRGPQVTRQYATRQEWNAKSKILDGDTLWHRMGDVGYLDAAGRFWMCGRKNHRVRTPAGPLYTVPCEAIINVLPDVERTALVGIGPAGEQRPVLIVQPADAAARTGQEREELLTAVRKRAGEHPLTAGIEHFLIHPDFPVDIRHNAKIFREQLAQWAQRQLKGQG